MAVPEELLAILRCIECYSELTGATGETPTLMCTGCGLHYPVEDDIPVMLPEAAFRPESP